MPQIPVFMNWSGGKDSAMALWQLSRDPRYSVHCLLTTLSNSYRRVSMHGVRETLMDLQAGQLGLTLKKVWLPEKADMETYRLLMTAALADLKKEGIIRAAYGDIFLEDLRAWRVAQLAGLGMEAIFPIWATDTLSLAKAFIAAGFKAIVVCVDSQWLGKEHAGRLFDLDFIKSLPAGVDPCGENGEFHTFVFDGPMFKEPVRFQVSTIVERVYPLISDQKETTTSGEEDQKAGKPFNARSHKFYFCDLVPVDPGVSLK